MAPQLVYFIGFEQHNILYLKIGVSNNINRRLKSLNTGCPFKLKTYGLIEQAVDAFKLEKFLHKHFRQYKHGGEWLALPFSFDVFAEKLTGALYLSEESNYLFYQNFKRKAERKKLGIRRGQSHKKIVDAYCQEYNISIEEAVIQLKQLKLINKKFIYP